jgi:hypothetical protein
MYVSGELGQCGGRQVMCFDVYYEERLLFTPSEYAGGVASKRIGNRREVQTTGYQDKNSTEWREVAVGKRNTEFIRRLTPLVLYGQEQE